MLARISIRPRKFPRSGIKRVPDRECASHLRWLRGRECLVADSTCAGRMQPHHVKREGNGGTALKPPDAHAVPLCFHHHIEVLHQIGARAFEQRYGINLPYAA